MRKFLIAVVLLLGVIFLIGRFAEMQNVGAVLMRGNFGFILLALILETIWIGVVGLTYQSIYGLLGMPVKAFHMARVAAAATFVNVIAPAGGLSSVALFVTTARDGGHSTARATVASVLFLWLEYAATLAVLTIGLGEMARRNNLHWSEITASLILLAGALGIAVLLYLGMISAALLGSVLARGARAVNFFVRPFLHREYLSTERAYSFAAELSEGISALRASPRSLFRPVLLAALNKGLLILILTLTFLAFDRPFNPAAIIAAFSIAYLFLIVSPTPAGLGIVEGIMTVALSSLDVPIESAAVITLAYRGITFWVPLLVGMVTLRSIRR